MSGVRFEQTADTLFTNTSEHNTQHRRAITHSYLKYCFQFWTPFSNLLNNLASICASYSFTQSMADKLDLLTTMLVRNHMTVTALATTWLLALALANKTQATNHSSCSSANQQRVSRSQSHCQDETVDNNSSGWFIIDDFKFRINKFFKNWTNNILSKIIKKTTFPYEKFWSIQKTLPKFVDLIVMT